MYSFLFLIYPKHLSSNTAQCKIQVMPALDKAIDFDVLCLSLIHIFLFLATGSTFEELMLCECVWGVMFE